VLNRIYIVVGVLAIIVLGAAFIAPYFISWGDYRTRMEELATRALGTPVTVRGDIDFALLPQPRLAFKNVLVGSPEEPAATVDSVEAEFALIDFLRDNYTITKLVLRQPVIDFDIDESGFFGSGVALAEGTGGVGLGQASIIDATARLYDKRSGESFVAEKLSGDLRLSSFSGPFAFQGSGDYRGEGYALRLNSSAQDSAGSARLSFFVAPQAGGFSFTTEGVVTPGMAPKFDGNFTYRQSPGAAGDAAAIRGDLVFTSKFTASTDRLVFSGYTLQPDENRAGTRLTGAASVQLGATRSFDAVISGGVLALPARDATEDSSAHPYEFVRLLTELPAPPLPPLPGRVGIDLAEIGLRGFSLRNVRVDAKTDGKTWQVEQALAQLPGDTRLRASGQLASEARKPVFRGQLSLDSARLDNLVALWRKPSDNNPLFGQSAKLEGSVMLSSDALGILGSTLTLLGEQHTAELRFGFGEEHRLDVVGKFHDLGRAGSALIEAMLPDGKDPIFARSFPVGSFALSADSAQVLGYDGTRLVATGQWQAGLVTLSRLSAEDWGGLGFDATLTASGTLAKPELSGSGRLRIGSGTAPALTSLYDAGKVPQGWRDAFALSAPAELLVEISEPLDGGQVIVAGGAFGVGDLNLRAELNGGLTGSLEAPVRISGAIESSDVDGLTSQIGLGAVPIFSGEGSMLFAFNLSGTPTNSLGASLTASLGSEAISFDGDLFAGKNGEITGKGMLDVALDNASGFAALVGAEGVSLPQIRAEAELYLEGLRLARLSAISGSSGGLNFSGDLGLTRTGETTAVSGALEIDQVSVEGLVASLFGTTALVGGDDVWPIGPISIGDNKQEGRGTVAVSAKALTFGDKPLFDATSFDLVWDENRSRLARFASAKGDASVTMDMSVCCSGPLPEKTISGRLTLAGLPLSTAFPASAGSLSGLLDGGVQFEATGASLAELMASAAGEGNLTIADFAADQFSPGLYSTIATLESVIAMNADALEALMSIALRQGKFLASRATNTFSIAGGVARLTNLIFDGDAARLAGGLTLGLEDLSLNGTFVMTPQNLADGSGLVTGENSRVVARLAGSVPQPVVSIDLEEMIAGVLVRANELEVDRLEALRLEDVARQRAAAEERNRLIEAQRKKAAEEKAKREAEEAARAAAEEERLRLEELLQAPSVNQPIPQGALDLGLPPPPPLANQPLSNGVNQAF
jgi:hypothetical protein